MTIIYGFEWLGPTAEDFNRGSPTGGEFVDMPYGEMILEETEREEPPSDTELDELVDSREYEKVLIKVLTWKGKATNLYFERFHDADITEIDEAANNLVEEDYISIQELSQRIII